MNNIEAKLKDANSKLADEGRGPWALIPIDEIRVNPDQPRSAYDAQKMKELTESVRDKGVIEPIIVIQIEDVSSSHKFELIAGERRCRAAKGAGLTHIPAIITVCKGNDRHTIALIENLTRDDLKPLETLISLGKLAQEFDSTAEVANELKMKDRTVSRYVKTFKALSSVPGVLDRLKNRLTKQAKESTKDKSNYDDISSLYELAEVMVDIKKLAESKSKTDQREYERILARIEKQELKTIARNIRRKIRGESTDRNPKKVSSYFAETDQHITFQAKLSKSNLLTTEDRDGIRQEVERFLAAINTLAAAEPVE